MRLTPIEEQERDAQVRARIVEIRQRLDIIEARGLGAVRPEDVKADLKWLLAEHKRLRRGGA